MLFIFYLFYAVCSTYRSILYIIVASTYVVYYHVVGSRQTSLTTIITITHISISTSFMCVFKLICMIILDDNKVP